MKILHFSDLHLGVDNYGSIDARSGLSSRVNDFLRVLDTIVDDAITGQYDVVLFSGDAFKNRDPSPTLQREFARRIGRLVSANIPTVLLVGNHDLPSVVVRATAIDIYSVLEIPGIHVVRGMSRVDVQTRSGLLQVVAVPWLTRSMVLALDEYRTMSDEDIDRAMASVISQTVQHLSSQLDPAHPSVLTAHVSIQGAEFGHEKSIMLGRDVTVGMDDLSARRFDYVALGHIHKHQQIGVAPPAVYAGSPERIDFGEERDEKGYVSVEIVTGETGQRTTKWTFIRTRARPFLTLRYTPSVDDPMEYVRDRLEKDASKIDGAIVRCFVEVERGMENAVNLQEIRRTLQDLGASHVAHVVAESDTSTRARVELDADAAMNSLRMLQHWIELRNFDVAMRDRVLSRGRELIERRTHNLTRKDDVRG